MSATQSKRQTDEKLTLHSQRMSIREGSDP